MFSSREIKWYLLWLLAVMILLCFDQGIISWIRAFRSANPDINQILQYTDKAAYYAAHGTPLITGAVLLWLAGRFFKHEIIKHRGKQLLIGFLASGASVQVIKHLIGRARPRITDQFLLIGPTFRGSYDSLPSGHAAMAFCLAYLCSGYFPKYRALFYLYAILVCLGRVGSASHFPADVLAGALLGTIVARLAEKIVCSGETQSGVQTPEHIKC
jgi:membrane-associated phospholipid phosphatase